MNKNINNVVELTEKELACVCGGEGFSPEIYQALLRQCGLTPERYEAYLKDPTLLRRLIESRRSIER